MFRSATLTLLLGCTLLSLASAPNSSPSPQRNPTKYALSDAPTAAKPATVAAPAPTLLTLRVGFAHCDITPDKSANLMGYNFRAPGNDGISEPLLAKVCVLRDGQTRAVLVSFDLCVIPTEIARKLREKIAAMVKCETAAVLLAASHTHSGPYPFADYFAGIETKLLDTVKRAAGLAVPYELRVREAPLGIGYNRRVWNGEKVSMCWNPQSYPELNPGPAPDPTCTVVHLRQQNGPRQLVWWSLGVHPVTLGKTSRSLSGDYPAAACRVIETDLPDSHAMFFLGAAGNVHPWIATQDRVEGVNIVGRAVGSFVSLLTHATQPVHRMEGDADSSTKPNDGKNAETEIPPAPSAIRCVAETVKIGTVEVDLAIWRVGDLWIAAAPVELFGELGTDLRKRLPGPVLLATLANGWHGYWPTREAFAQGGYEVGAIPSGLKAGDPERLIDELVRLSEKLSPRQENRETRE